MTEMSYSWSSNAPLKRLVKDRTAGRSERRERKRESDKWLIFLRLTPHNPRRYLARVDDYAERMSALAGNARQTYTQPVFCVCVLPYFVHGSGGLNVIASGNHRTLANKNDVFGFYCAS